MNGLATAVMHDPLRVKFLSKTHEDDIASLWSPLIPATGFEGVEFTFDANDQNYDFLAVYEGLPKWAFRRHYLPCALSDFAFRTRMQSHPSANPLQRQDSS